MSAMGYYPRVRRRRHLPAHSALGRSSNSQVENSHNDHQESASDLSMDSCSVDVLPGPPAAPPALAANNSGASTARPALSEESTPMPQDKSESINSCSGVIPDSGADVDVTHDWECVRSLRQLSANADSECGIEDSDWASGCTSYADIMRTRDDDESEAKSCASDTGDDSSHAARRWDLIPEDFNPPGVHKDTPFLRMHGRPLDSRRTPPERSTQRSAHSRTLNVVPHRRIHLPLLSTLVSLLSIDDETFHLVTHSPAHSVLFPGPIYPSDEEIEEVQEIHGVHAVLSRHGALREGLAVACDESALSSNPFRLSASPLIGLLDIVRGLFEGGMALKRVYQ